LPNLTKSRCSHTKASTERKPEGTITNALVVQNRTSAIARSALPLGQSLSELARILARDPSTITRWLQKYRKQGLAGLLEIKKPPGQDPTIKGEVLELLKARLNSPEGFGSYGEIVSWLAENHGLDVSYRMAHYLVRYKLQAKLKVPRPCSVNQNPEAIETFKKTFHKHC
jgi:transposase